MEQRTVPMEEAKASLPRLVQLVVEQGIRVVITEHGHPQIDLVRHVETSVTPRKPRPIPERVTLLPGVSTTDETLEDLRGR